MSAVVNPAGWVIWNTGDERTGGVELGEYDNTGAGSVGTRAAFAMELNQPVEMEEVLGSGYQTAAWVDLAYLS